MLSFILIVSWILIIFGILIIYCSAIVGGPSYVGWRSDSCNGPLFLIGLLFIAGGVAVNHSRTLTDKWQTEFMKAYKISEAKPDYSGPHHPGEFFVLTEIKDSCSMGKIAEFDCGKNSVGKSIKYLGLIPNGTTLNEVKSLYKYRTRHIGEGLAGERWIYIAHGLKPIRDTLIFSKEFQEENKQLFWNRKRYYSML